MTARSILGGVIGMTRLLLLAGYALLLLPALVFGFAAFSDYQGRGCPDGNQCSDAVSTMTIISIFVFAVPAIWLLLGIPYRRLRVELNA